MSHKCRSPECQNLIDDKLIEEHPIGYVPKRMKSYTTFHRNVSEKLSDSFVLKIIQIGTDRVNYKILKMLPNNINNIMKELELKKVPANVRTNTLEKVGLVKR